MSTAAIIQEAESVYMSQRTMDFVRLNMIK